MDYKHEKFYFPFFLQENMAVHYGVSGTAYIVIVYT